MVTQSQKKISWAHKYSRLLIGSIAIIGVLITANLTWAKLQHQGVCSTEGCDIVLSSPYANIGDFPLTALGLLSYLTVALMAFAPILLKSKTHKAVNAQIDRLTWLGLSILGVGMAVFSCYLMYLLAFEIKAVCLFCITSAILTFSICGLTFIGHDWEDLGQIIFNSIATALLSIVISLFLHHNANSYLNSLEPSTPVPPIPGVSWEITTASSADEIKLAEHLSQTGVKIYGSYTCHNCFKQKQLFGTQAWKKINYIECAADAAKNPQPGVCQQAGITHVPTWSIDGKLEPGVKTLAELAKLTRYSHNTVFKYDRLFTGIK